MTDKLTIHSQVIHSPAADCAGQDTDGRYVLPVQWLYQHTVSAQHAPGDCGPAGICMAIHYLTNLRPTVDEVSIAGGVPENADWASLRQMQRAAQHFGVGGRFVQPITFNRILQEIRAGVPVLVLVNYAKLIDHRPEKAHFVLVVGFSPGSFIYHDPNQPDGRFIEMQGPKFLNAMNTTSRTPGNTNNNHAITFYV